MSSIRERFIACLEAYRNEAEDAYFKARPQIDTIQNRTLFKAGYSRGFEKNWPLSNEVAIVESAEQRDPNCDACHGDGEYFGHTADCNDDLCALNGDQYSCAGQVMQCGCTPPQTKGEPHA